MPRDHENHKSKSMQQSQNNKTVSFRLNERLKHFNHLRTFLILRFLSLQILMKTPVCIEIH